MPAEAPAIEAGSFHAYFIFDVADTIDLTRLVAMSGARAEPAPLRMRPALSPGNIQFAVAPIVMSLPPFTHGGRTGHCRAKIFDYGVVSIRVTFPYEGDWTGFVSLAAAIRGDDLVLAAAHERLDAIVRDYAPALVEPHATLVEDYYISTVERFDRPVTSESLLHDRADDLVALVTAEPNVLGVQERREALRVHFSYFENDLVVVLWDAAFVYENREDAEVIEDILEFANSQLVEFRTYDARLDAELEAIHRLDRGRRTRPLGRRAAEQRSSRLGFMLVDIRELADRASNALKIIGDAYYARIYRGTAARLRLDEWQRQIDSKLDSISEIYRYLVDQAQTARSEFLELIVIILIAIEIVVGVVGLRH